MCINLSAGYIVINIPVRQSNDFENVLSINTDVHLHAKETTQREHALLVVFINVKQIT